MQVWTRDENEDRNENSGSDENEDGTKGGYNPLSHSLKVLSLNKCWFKFRNTILDFFKNFILKS